MDIKQSPNLDAITRQFNIPGDFISGEPCGNGHINDTFRVTVNQGGACVNYILQRVNTNVFKNVAALMDNICRVSAHINAKLAGQPDFTRRVLTPITTRNGQLFFPNGNGCWRAYVYIEKARTMELIESPKQAFEAARSFGQFQKLLADLPAPRLHDTIPDFHHTPKRFERLETAIKNDSAGRVRLAGPEIDFAIQRNPITRVLLDACLPERVTHNDTKLNNILFDETTGEGICIIDLDTVMPGLALYDFGDMVHTMTSPAAEDERDLSKVEMRLPMFEALARGYLAATGDFLTRDEKDLLAFSGKLITFEIGIRFLTDFLEGDPYFKIHRDGHNLDRARTQFKLVESIERQEGKMKKLIETSAKLN